MPRLLFRIALFLSSYAPLFGLLAFTNRHSTAAWVTLSAVAVGGLVGLAAVMAATAREDGPDLHVNDARPRNGEVLAYISTYLIPFIGVDLTTLNGVVLFVGFLLVLMVVYVNSEMLLVNPVLSIAGYRSFEVTDPDDHTYSVITRRRDIDPATTIAPAQITRYLRLEVRRGG